MVAATTPHTQPLVSWTEAVQRVSALAQARMPEALQGAIQRATALVLAGAVCVEEDGATAMVRSSDGHTWYAVQGTCPCAAAAFAPDGLCKHRLGTMIYKRASQVQHEPLAAEEEPTAPAIGPEHLVMIQGKPFVKYAGLLALALAQGLVRLEARFISVTAELALADATATFADGRVFREAGDATPANVGRQVQPHFARMALTRAKGRALRDALNIAMCTVEELGDTA